MEYRGDVLYKSKWQAQTHDRTNRSRLTQSGFFGLKVMNLFHRTCATGAMPMGAPGWPELAWNVASTCLLSTISTALRCQKLSPFSIVTRGRCGTETHGQQSDGADSELVGLVETHLGCQLGFSE